MRSTLWKIYAAGYVILIIAGYVILIISMPIDPRQCTAYWMVSKVHTDHIHAHRPKTMYSILDGK